MPSPSCENHDANTVPGPAPTDCRLLAGGRRARPGRAMRRFRLGAAFAPAPSRRAVSRSAFSQALP
ncbi:hypothetical protein [Lysobacter gummosus]|uniref:hypothetical protein n=1 Tax=Lysobacter gummosus TaxID=262324 RepID=UPI003628206E